MKIGLVSDLHQGYHHGQRIAPNGVNVREQDFISAAWSAIRNLKDAGVELILDGGDMAHVPAPKKRAIQTLIDLIKFAEVPFLSADGNHTSLKGSGDVHLYHILESECPNFTGATTALAREINGLTVGLVPHSYDPQTTIDRLEYVQLGQPDILVGHWAASDIQYDSAQVPLEHLPPDIPVFLGHYHRHTEQRRPLPTYIGSTERTAWDQWDYPTGATIYDTDTGRIEYVQHQTRTWHSLEANPDNYLDLLDSEDLEDALVRLTVTADRKTYGTLNTREAKRKAYALGALTFHIRRAKDKNEEELVMETYEGKSIDEAWLDHVKGTKVPKAMRERIGKIGIEALNA